MTSSSNSLKSKNSKTHNSGHRSKTCNTSSPISGSSSSSNNHHTQISTQYRRTSPSMSTPTTITPSQVQAHISTKLTPNISIKGKRRSKISWLKVSSTRNMITRMWKMSIGKISTFNIIRHFLYTAKRIRTKAISIKAGTVSISVKVKPHPKWLTRKYPKPPSPSMIGCYKLKLSIRIPWKVDWGWNIMWWGDFLLDCM